MRLETEQMAAVYGGQADPRQGGSEHARRMTHGMGGHMKRPVPPFLPITHERSAVTTLPLTAKALSEVLWDVPEHAEVTFEFQGTPPVEDPKPEFRVPTPAVAESVRIVARWVVGP